MGQQKSKQVAPQNCGVHAGGLGCGDALQQSFTYKGYLSEGAKVVASDGALAVFVSDTLRNVQWPESIGSLYLQRIVRVQDDLDD